jgi:hypothetical protein
MTDNRGSTRRTFLGMGLGFAATSILARTGVAQDGAGRTGNAPGKEPRKFTLSKFASAA